MAVDKKRTKRHIEIYNGDKLIYQGRWDDLPLAEELIIQKSIYFFNDPEPCYIHRNAVRIRLISELEQAIPSNLQEIPSKWLEQLSAYIGIAPVTYVNFSEK